MPCTCRLLAGRSQPGDGSSLEARQGVTCDVCHRMVEPDDGPTHIGDGQYTISDHQTNEVRVELRPSPVTALGVRISKV